MEQAHQGIVRVDILREMGLDHHPAKWHGWYRLSRAISPPI